MNDPYITYPFKSIGFCFCTVDVGIILIMPVYYVVRFLFFISILLVNRFLA